MGGIPPEAYAFLGAVFAFLTVLIVFFLYLNKKLCFKDVGGFPCMDQPPKKETKAEKLGTAYAQYEDEETSSDSDDEVLQRYQESIQRGSIAHASHISAGGSSKHSDKRGEQEQLMSLAEQGDSQELGPADEQLVSSPSSPSPEHQYKNEGYQRDAASPTSTEQGYTDSQDEQLFDVSDLQEREPVLISKCGSLEVTFSYDTSKSRMSITVLQAREIPSKDRGGASNSQIRLLLLPTKKVRYKTKVKPGDNPEFGETFKFNVSQEDLSNFGVRFRLYGSERMRRERMIGETVVGFASLSTETATTHWLTLEPRSNLGHGDSKTDIASLTRSDSASSTQSMQHGGMPELLIGLSYNGTTGRLSAEVIKGSNFRNMAMNRAPDTYVKLTLMSPNGQEITRSKTSIRRGQPNPLFKETFMFQVALFQLPDVTLMVSVYNKRSMKRKEMIGWFSLGYNNSGEEELSHWTDMRESRGEQVCRWHMLLEA